MPPTQRRAIRLGAQAAVFLLGLGAMGWAVALALQNRDQLTNLSEASAGQVAALLGLSLATQTINGTIFWLTLRPARRLRLADVIATNAVSSALAYLPFKLGAVARIVIHNRRDKVPLVQIGAWFAAVALTMVLAFTPPVLAALWLKRIDAAWIAATLAGELAVAGLVLGLAYRFKGPRGNERLVRICRILRLRPLMRLLHSRIWHHLHSAFDMLAHPGATGGVIALRLADALVNGLRFMVAAQILGVSVGFAPSLVISLAYFVIGSVSPVMVGAREMGAIGIAALMLPGAVRAGEAAYATIPIFVTATEAVVFLATGTLGIVWLRIGRRRNRGDAPQPAPEPATTPPEESPLFDAGQPSRAERV
jgi:hypothetical protein